MEETVAAQIVDVSNLTGCHCVSAADMRAQYGQTGQFGLLVRLLTWRQR